MRKVSLNVKRALHVVVVVMAVIGASASVGVSIPAGATTVSTAFYLDIGGSESVGYQPTLDSPHGQRTDSGFAEYLIAHEAARGVSMHLTEIGCGGETTETMLTGGDGCYALPDTQLLEAVAFLDAHRNESGLVTIDLGFNDILTCLRDPTIERTCVDPRIEKVREQMPLILSELKAAAGPNVIFVGLGHYDPFLANYLYSDAGETFADDSRFAVEHLDHVLSDAYGAAGIPMADVGAAFETDDTTPVDLAGEGTVPDNVAEICLLTWMCQTYPYGPNIHPNDAGFEAIADAIAAQLPSGW